MARSPVVCEKRDRINHMTQLLYFSQMLKMIEDATMELQKKGFD